MKTSLRLTFLFALFIAVPFVTSAQTTNDALRAQIAQLTQLIAQLEQQITAAQGQGTSSGTSCLTLSRNLGPNASGTDVTALQNFLRAQGVFSADSTGFYGSVTVAAVQQWQARRGIITSGTPDSTGFGAVGPRTRTLIQSASCAVVIPPPPSQLPPVVTVPVPSAPRPCVFNNVTLASGESRSFFSVPQTQLGNSTCASYLQVRTCTDGALSGSPDYAYLSCINLQPSTCSLGGVTVQSGSSQTFYSQSQVSSGSSCSSYAQVRQCTNGILSGSGAYYLPSCSRLSCALNGLVVPDASSALFYYAQNVPADELCSSYSQSRTCSSGVLNGDAIYQYTSCAPVATGTCALDNKVLTNGSSAVFYTASVAPAGKTCASISLNRTCTNGALGGSASYVRSACTDNAPCTLDGITLAHSSSTIFYSARTVAFGTTCASKAQTRTCTNGALGGTATYQYASCSVSPPTAYAPSSAQSQLAALVAPLGSLLGSFASGIR